jgi:hypothetical protein
MRRALQVARVALQNRGMATVDPVGSVNRIQNASLSHPLHSTRKVFLAVAWGVFLRPSSRTVPDLS